MAAKYWLKLYHEMVDDPKVAMLPDSSYRRFVECMLFAGELDEGGNLPPIELMAWRLHLDETSLAQDMSRLALAGLVELKEGGRWFVTKFAERQAPASSTERSRRSRASSTNQHGDRETWRTEIYSILPAQSGVYKLWIDGSGRAYIGSSKNIQQRIKQHLSEIGVDHHKMNADFVTYGMGAVRADVLELVEIERMSERESYWIGKYDFSKLYNSETKGKVHRQHHKDAIATNRPTDIDIDIDIDKEKNTHTSSPNQKSHQQQEYIPDPIADFITQLSTISKTPYWPKTEEDYQDAAIFLHGKDATKEDILRFGEWWEAHGWHDEKPVLTNVINSWQNFIDGVIPAVYSNSKDGNGRKRTLKNAVPDEYKDIIKR